MAEGKRRWTGLLLVMLPTWLVVSAGVGLWWQIRQTDRRRAEAAGST